jgi:hypothetical protein
MFFVFNDDCYVKKRKKVKFYSLVNVIIIPSRLDYYTFLHELWWRDSDYTSFYTSANKELKEFVKKHPNMTFSNAKKILYQPNYVYDKFFFDEDTI